MKKNHNQVLVVLMLLFGMLLLAACTAEATGGDPAPAAEEQTEQTGQAEQAEPTLEDLLGEDYVSYLTETITMQMDNRMQDQGTVEYYPIRDEAPLTDYVPMDETTEFEINEEGNVVILLPAGTVADENHGDQTFIVPTP